jgi:hypothetical protein
VTTWNMSWTGSVADDGVLVHRLRRDLELVTQGTYRECYDYVLEHGNDADTYREAGLYGATVAALRTKRAEQVAKLAARDAVVQP